MPSERRAHWIMYLQQFKFEIIHRPGKDNKNADALSRILEVQCFFIGVENKGGEENSEENLKKFQKQIPWNKLNQKMMAMKENQKIILKKKSFLKRKWNK